MVGREIFTLLGWFGVWAIITSAITLPIVLTGNAIAAASGVPPVSFWEVEGFLLALGAISFAGIWGLIGVIGGRLRIDY